VLAEYMAESHGGEGDIIVVEGVVESSNYESGRRLHEVLKEYPTSTSSASSPWPGCGCRRCRQRRTLLQSNPEIDGIYAMNDEMGMGVLAALRSAGREEEVVNGQRRRPAGLVCEIQRVRRRGQRLLESDNDHSGRCRRWRC
jgi:ribose transport system substrate-binding protein